MILFIAGTNDARELAVKIKKSGYSLLATVVTENAALELRKVGLNVITGRLTSEDFIRVMKKYEIETVIDASHPFAEEVSKNAIEATQLSGITYIRYERENQLFQGGNITVVESYVEAAEKAFENKGVIFLTTGSKTLEIFTKKLLGQPNIRLIARMLPRKDNLEKCEELAFPQKNIVAIQGPFTKEFNLALYTQFNVTTVITKDSGKEGSVEEKIEAAKELGIKMIIIKRPNINYKICFQSFSEIITYLNQVKKS